MCLINFQWQVHDQYPLIVAANRDESYKRPTAEAHFWEDHPDLLAGRDLLEHGTWLGITKSGRFAALTNYRDPQTMYQTFERSRGDLVKDFLVGSLSPTKYLERIRPLDNRYNGFNLLVGTMDELFYYNNIERDIIEVGKGTYSLSNHFLNTPWPKVTKGRQKLQAITDRNDVIEHNQLFELLTDREIVADEFLPDTGVGQTLERQLSPLFIQMDAYGTRSSTALTIDREGQVMFSERTYEQGALTDEVNFDFKINL